MVVVNATGAGNGLPEELTVTSPGNVLSSCVRLKNSVAVPSTATASPATTVGALDVNTKIASEVAGLLSSLTTTSCMKKPFVFRAVTMPVVLTNCPAKG